MNLQFVIKCILCFYIGMQNFTKVCLVFFNREIDSVIDRMCSSCYCRQSVTTSNALSSYFVYVCKGMMGACHLMVGFKFVFALANKSDRPP